MTTERCICVTKPYIGCPIHRTQWTHTYTSCTGAKRRCIMLPNDEPNGLQRIAVEADVPVPDDHPQRYSERAVTGWCRPDALAPIGK